MQHCTISGFHGNCWEANQQSNSCSFTGDLRFLSGYSEGQVLRLSRADHIHIGEQGTRRGDSGKIRGLGQTHHLSKAALLWVGRVPLLLHPLQEGSETRFSKRREN